jgi:hypothetical protein
MIDWNILIDLFQDKKYMKAILTKGNGYSRCKRNDEVSCNFNIINILIYIVVIIILIS